MWIPMVKYPGMFPQIMWTAPQGFGLKLQMLQDYQLNRNLKSLVGYLTNDYSSYDYLLTLTPTAYHLIRVRLNDFHNKYNSLWKGVGG